jgi:tripartite-type tricarboxylate transporter receptor subunit TctC
MKTSNKTSRRSALGFIGAAALAAGTSVTTSALAQSNITRLVVAFPPGGPVDFVARTISEQLGKDLGSQVVVENMAGANGAIAAQYVTKTAPEGTLWLTSVGAVAINPVLYDRLSYNPTKDLAPVSLVVNNVEVMVVNANNPASTGAGFVANAKLSKDGATMGSSGTGSVPHLAMELLASATGAPLLHIPYKGAAPAISAVMSGQVDGFFGDIPGLIGFIKSGRIKPIGLAATKRHPLLPDVRTFQEMGIPGVDSDNWYAIFTSKATPPKEIDRLNKAIKATLANESVRAKLSASGAEPSSSTPAELATLLKNDTAKWGKVIRAKKIRPE